MNKRLESLTWKKIILGIFATILVLFLVREIVFWIFFEDFSSGLHQTMAHQEQEIDEQIKKTARELHEDSEEMDKRSKKFEETVNEMQQKTMDSMDRMERQQEARDAAFTKSFEEAPQKMLEQHKKLSEAMLKDYISTTKTMDKAFKQGVMDVDKTIDKVRCEIALNKAMDALPEPNNLTKEELRERRELIKRFQKRMAKNEHCEAYL